MKSSQRHCLQSDTPYHLSTDQAGCRVRLLHRPGNPLAQSAGHWIHVPWNSWAGQDFCTDPTSLDGVSISGPTTGTVGTTYTFTATVSPPTATTPISYTWSPTPDSGQGTASVSYTWTTAGVKTITVTAANAGGVVSDTHVITITGLTVRVITYEYDPLGRLVEADYNTGERFEYRCDEVGNRLRYTQTITGTTVITYGYDAANRLTNVNGVEYSWDNNGNLINDGTRVYTYSQSNRLVAISEPGLEWSAVYNGDGARLRQMVNGSVTTYTLDLAAPLVTVLAQQDANGTKHYVYARGTRPLAQDEASTWVYLLPDGLGSVRQETDATGNLLATRSFDPYGVPLEGDGGAPFGYAGEQYDASTELLFLRARYYDPVIGRFLSKDPWEGNPSRPNTLHGFSYADNNPVLFADPSGWAPGPGDTVGESELENYVNCSLWPFVWGGSGLCKRANRSLVVHTDPIEQQDILDAREQIYYKIAESCKWGICPTAGEMLLRFLEKKGDWNIPTSMVPDIPTDYEVTRATKHYHSKSVPNSPDKIYPLLHEFLARDVRSQVRSEGVPTKVKGDYKGDNGFYVAGGGSDRPRAEYRDYWLAFGHFPVHGSFSGMVMEVCWGGTYGYVVDYTATYVIDDKYEWKYMFWTGIPGWGDFWVGAGQNVFIPDGWAASLAEFRGEHGEPRAQNFNYTIRWPEKAKVFVDSEFTFLRPGMGLYGVDPEPLVPRP